MKHKLTITVDAELVPVAKRYARSRGVWLSSIIELSLREVAGEQAPSLAARWRGKFRPAERDNARHHAIVSRNVRDYARSPIPAVHPQVPNSELF